MADGSLADSPQASRLDETPVTLLGYEWTELGDIAMALHGAMSLCRNEGFDESTGAKELLDMIHRRYESILSRIRERILDEEARPGQVSTMDDGLRQPG